MLSLALIVKDEEKNLARCLDSVKGLWDELVIVDTGSTDKTIEIAKKYTDKIYHFKWIKHFAKARNFAFSKCTGDWIMWVDADDILKPEDVKIIKEEFLKISQMSHLDYILINYHYWVENGISKATQLRERIIRKEKAVWVGRCHEIVSVDWGRSYSIPNAAVWHLRDEADRQADSNRNLELMILEAEEFPTQRNYFYLGNEYIGKPKEALKCYLKAYELKENVDTTFQAAYKIAQAYHDRPDFNEAISWYLRAIQHCSAYREPFLGLGTIYMDLKDYGKATFWLESSLNISEPVNPVMVILKENYTWVPYNLLSQTYFQLKNYKKAIEASEKLYECVRQPHILNDIEVSKNALKATYKRPSGTTKLNLGSGGKTISGFINCDLFPQVGVDEVFSLEEIPYADKSVDEISSEHALEHLPRLQGEKAIKEWSRVLKRGGKLSLKVPDLEECCRMFIEKPHLQDSWYMHTLYGVQDFRDTKDAPFKDKVNYGQIHFTGFTSKRLKILLTEAGFVVDKLEKYDGWDTPSLSVEAHIPALNSEDIKKIAFINNTLVPKYLSYGDYWEDAFRAAGHQVDVFRYENINKLPSGYDLYFFIEAGGRYKVYNIPDHAHPRILYSQENPSDEELNAFDTVATPSRDKKIAWSRKHSSIYVIPNENHAEQVKEILGYGTKKIVVASSLDRIKLTDPKTKMVDIIIPSYKNVEYLKLTIKSVKKNTENYRLIVVNSGDDLAVRTYLQTESGITFIDSTERLSFSQAVNRGLKASSNDVVILNNDTLVGKNWLEGYRNTPFDIINPFSNCDAGWIHHLYPVAGGVRLQPNMTKEEVDFEKITDMESPYKDLLARNQPGQSWVAFYATYVKRKVIDEVGYLDEKFINGGEDYDYCRRAVKLGFTCGHDYSSWVFHFGGKTRKVSENDNYQQHHEEDRINNSYMQFKDRPTTVIYTGPAWEKWDISNLNTKGIGGSETCAAMLALQFAKMGYRSIIIGDCEEKIIDNVEYIPWQKFDSFKESNYIDYFISSRTIAPFQNGIKNGLNLVWVHDIWLSQEKNLGNIDQVDKFICLSPWHAQFFSDHHSIPRDRILIQDNGFDCSLYSNNQIERDPYRLIYSSSPDRGLDNLLQMFGGWKKKFPKLSLHVFYGFENWQKALTQRNDPREKASMENILNLMKQDGVIYHGRVPQNQLAIEQMKSSLWVYPTNFSETWCLTSAQAMLAGAVPITTNVAALQTTIPAEGGVKVSFYDEFVETVFNFLDNPKLQEPYRKFGQEYARKFDWPIIGKQWKVLFDNLSPKK